MRPRVRFLLEELERRVQNATYDVKHNTEYLNLMEALKVLDRLRDELSKEVKK